MTIPDEELATFNAMTAEYKEGLFPADALAFMAGNLIIDYDSPEFIHSVPSEISAQLLDMLAVLEESGEVFSYSSTGTADHTDYARRLSLLLKK